MRVSNFYDQEVETSVKTATGLIEALTNYVLGGVVAGHRGGPRPRALMRPICQISRHAGGWRGPRLHPRQDQIAAGASLGAEACAAAGFTGLFVVFFATHLLFDTASFDQFSEATNRLLDRFPLPHVQLNHNSSFRYDQRKTPKRRTFFDRSAQGNLQVYTNWGRLVHPSFVFDQAKNLAQLDALARPPAEVGLMNRPAPRRWL